MFNFVKGVQPQVRYELVGRMFQKTHMQPSQIAEICGLSEKTIRKGISFYQSPYLLPIRGRPKLLQPQHLLFIEAKTMSNRSITNQELVEELMNNFDDFKDKGLHPTTVCRARHQLGLHYLPARFNCATTQNSRDKRVIWCTQQLNRDWKNIIFSDESWFELGVRRKWLWRHFYDNEPDVNRPTQRRLWFGEP